MYRMPWEVYLLSNLGSIDCILRVLSVYKSSKVNFKVQWTFTYYLMLMILLAGGAQELQTALHGIHHYCNTWKLEINTRKTKIMIISKGEIRTIPNFVYNSNTIEVVFTFRYLGIDLRYNGKFNLCKKHLCSQAQQAMYSIL